MVGKSVITASRMALLASLLLNCGALHAVEQAHYMLVLDVSNSMWAQIEGRSKMEITREVIGDLVRDWPASQPMGLVAYGHRSKRCDDIETLIPVEAVDAERFTRTLDTLEPRGRTPLTASLRHAAEDLDYRDQPATLIVFSDGVESCDQDPCALVRQLEEDNPLLTAHVVGFGLAADAAESQLSCIAELSGGRYFTAGTGSELHQVAQEIYAATVGKAAEAERLQASFERALKAQTIELDAALANGQLERAEEGLQALQRLVAELPEHRETLSTFEQQLAQLRTARERQEHIDSLRALAERAEAAGDAQRAQQIYGEILDLDAGNTAAQAASERLVDVQRRAVEEAEARREPYEPELVAIPGGCFEMGSPPSEEGRQENERQHRVCVDAFRIGKYEVSQAQWQMVMGNNPSRFSGCDDCPVEKVSWTEVNDYIAELNARTGQRYRLPTEAEWEYAARAGTQTAYWWGNSVGRNKANCDGCGNRGDDRHAAPIGSFAPNPWGLYDTAGNVWEWTCSAYDAAYGGAEQQCAGTTYAGQMALRGGSWGLNPTWARSATRFRYTPDARSYYLGFRLARD